MGRDRSYDFVRAICALSVNALLDCHDLALSCCREIARISVMEWSL